MTATKKKEPKMAHKSIDQILEDKDYQTQVIVMQLKSGIETLSARMSRMEASIDNLAGTVTTGLEKVNDRMWTNMYWIMGILLGGFAGMFAIIAHGFHWY